MSTQFIETIRFDDPRLGLPNDCFKGKFVNDPTLSISGSTVTLVPAQIMGDFASLCVPANGMLQFLQHAPFALAASVDSQSVEIPELGQRLPTEARKREIIEAWLNSNVTPNGYVETIHLNLYGCKMNKYGIDMSKGLICINDGGGRLASLEDVDMAQLNKIGLMFNLHFDLSGDKIKMNKLLLKINRDPKRMSKGTSIAAEVGILNSMPDSFKKNFKSFKDKMAATFIVQKLVSDYRTPDSWLSLTKWTTEAGRCSNKLVAGKGNIQSVVSTISRLSDLLDNCGVSPVDMPEMLDFGFRYFYRKCPRAVADAINHKGKNYHFHTTLAAQLMIALTAHIYPITDEKEFDDMVCKVFNAHYKYYRENYNNQKLKKVTPDHYFTSSKTFDNRTNFNSGIVAQNEINKVILCCREVIDKMK